MFAKKNERKKERKRKDVKEMMIAIVSEPSEEIQFEVKREREWKMWKNNSKKCLLIARSVQDTQEKIIKMKPNVVGFFLMKIYRNFFFS